MAPCPGKGNPWAKEKYPGVAEIGEPPLPILQEQARHISGGWDCSKRFYSCAPCLAGISPVVSNSWGDATSYLFKRMEIQDAPDSQARGCKGWGGG